MLFERPLRMVPDFRWMWPLDEGWTLKNYMGRLCGEPDKPHLKMWLKCVDAATTPNNDKQQTIRARKKVRLNSIASAKMDSTIFQQNCPRLWRQNNKKVKRVRWRIRTNSTGRSDRLKQQNEHSSFLYSLISNVFCVNEGARGSMEDRS